MKETGCVLLKSGVLTAEDLEKINRYTRRAFQEEELYTFSVVLCDNEVDQDMERFTVPALERLGELFWARPAFSTMLHRRRTRRRASTTAGWSASRSA